MREILIILTVLFLSIIPLAYLSSTSLNAVINEIAWMGTESSYNDEWIELYNNTNENINLDGWILKARDGTPDIALLGNLPAKGFFILERTDDNTLPDTKANQIYKGSLENSGENLELLDDEGNLIDSIDCSDNWFAGDNKTKQTMERKNPNLTGSDSQNWQTSKNPSGTPKNKNSLLNENQSQIEDSTETKPEEKLTANLSNSVGKERIEDGNVEAINERTTENGSAFPLSIAFPIAIISGIVIFILKKKLQVKY